VIFPSARVMLLSLLRDRGALAMAFVLPPLIFLIFAAIFTGSSGDQLRLHIGVADLARTPATSRLVQVLLQEPTLRVTFGEAAGADDVRSLVKNGSVDLGIILRGDLNGRDAGAPVLLVTHEARAIAGAIMAGHLQRLLSVHMPDVAFAQVLADLEQIGGITSDQRVWIDQVFREKATDAQTDPRPRSVGLIATESALPATAGWAVAYYAGAVAVMFLLLAGIQGAISLIEERRLGVYDRLLAGPKPIAAIITGKFLFLVAQGIVQAALVFTAASVFYGVNFIASFGFWLITTLVVAAATSGLALSLCAICSSRQQAQVLSTFVVLIISAAGGSMVPRFFMPPWLQALGWWTPNAWSIQAYSSALTPGSSVSSLVTAWAILMAMAAGALLFTLFVSLRRRSI
jgi:ABC-2 type transport system permease protein